MKKKVNITVTLVLVFQTHILLNTKMSNCNSCIGVLHLISNIILLILAICILGLGLAEETTLLTKIILAESKVGQVAVVIGVILIMACSLECCFALDGASVFYYVYAGILFVIFITLVGLFSAYGIDVSTTIEKEVTTSMHTMLKYVSDPGFETETFLDPIQEKLECCGVANYTDWMNSTSSLVPGSCCIKVGCDPSDPDQIYQEGCVSSIMKTAKPLFIKISAIGFSIMMLLPFQIALLVLMIKRAVFPEVELSKKTHNRRNYSDFRDDTDPFIL